jgi:hypothetical protein
MEKIKLLIVFYFFVFGFLLIFILFFVVGFFYLSVAQLKLNIDKMMKSATPMKQDQGTNAGNKKII